MDHPNPHPPGCFWHDWAQTLGAPNIKWCEVTRCAFVSEPANTWTNLAYLAVALVLFLAWRRQPNRTLTWFAPAVFAMGSLSFFYHLSNNFLSQLFDFVGMFLWVYLLLVIDLRRLGWLSRRAARGCYWLLVVGSSLGIVGLYRLEFPFQVVIAALALALVVAEIGLRFHPGGEGFSYRYFVLALGLILLAEGFSLLDVNRIWCQPDNAFLHGHALWHLIGALGTGVAWLHFRQFELD
jgi:hypothetical protein